MGDEQVIDMQSIASKSKHSLDRRNTKKVILVGIVIATIFFFLSRFIPRKTRFNTLKPPELGVFETRWLVVDLMENYAFCQVPKAANELWLMYFRKLKGLNDWNDPRKTFWSNRNSSGLVFGNDMSRHTLQVLLTQANLFKFGVVRHPLARFFSAFNNKIKNTDISYWRDIFKVDRGITVEDFIMKLSSMDPWQVDVHFQPQYIICALDHIDYDYIGKYENLEEAWITFQEFLAREDPLPSKNFTTAANAATHGAKSFMKWAKTAQNSQAWDRLLEFYKKDFDLLEYSPLSA